MSEVRVVAIDGPAGAGKSSVVRRVAAELGGRAFSTGTIFRAVTWIGLESGILRAGEDPTAADLERLGDEVEKHTIEIVDDGSELVVHVDGRAPGVILHSPEVSREIHWIADDAKLRDRILPLQRAVPPGPVILVEGRDIGSIVFPDARVKIFLTASVEERARRRHEELVQREGDNAPTLADVERDVANRDEFDRNRDVAPLIQVDDAILVDTTGQSIDEVVSAIVDTVPSDWR